MKRFEVVWALVLGLVVSVASSVAFGEGNHDKGGDSRARASNVLTDPLSVVGSIAIIFDGDVLFSSKKTTYSIDIYELEKVSENEYKGRVRLSNILPGRSEAVTITRDRLLPNTWNLKVGRFYVALPFIGPVLSKPLVFSGSPVLGQKQKVTKYFTLPKLKK